MSVLISAADLLSQLDDDQLVIVDCRHDLANPEAGRIAYATGHLPDARFLHLDDDLSGNKTGKNGRHPLPDAQTLSTKLGSIGISRQSKVVAYDAHGGMYAARLWWLLRWLGHDSVQVLDGGMAAWAAAGGRLSTETPSPHPQTYVGKPHNEAWVDVSAVVRNLSDPSFMVVDARAPSRFAGEGETLDPVAGHIPGAKNRFFQLNLDSQGCFKSADELREEWQALLGNTPANQTVQQCGSGVTACHNLLALAVAGLDGARLYAGSWSEWCSDLSRPVATGS